MWRTALKVGCGALIATPFVAITGRQPPAAQDVTFSKDVAPIVFMYCVSCHRPGEIGPFSMLTYNAAHPWARSIRQAVLTRRMPPWFADRSTSPFLNSKQLSDADAQTIVTWVDGGAREGNPKDMPEPPAFDDTWQIGTPDLIVTMSEPYKLPATSLIPDVTVPTDYVFANDTWVQAIEIRPGNRQAVHQALAVLGNRGLANGLYLLTVQGSSCAIPSLVRKREPERGPSFRRSVHH